MKRVPIPMLTVKIIENNKTHSVQEHLHISSRSAKVILASLTSSIFSVHSSTNL